MATLKCSTLIAWRYWGWDRPREPVTRVSDNLQDHGLAIYEILP